MYYYHLHFGNVLFDFYEIEISLDLRDDMHSTSREYGIIKIAGKSADNFRGR